MSYFQFFNHFVSSLFECLVSIQAVFLAEERIWIKQNAHTPDALFVWHIRKLRKKFCVLAFILFYFHTNFIFVLNKLKLLLKNTRFSLKVTQTFVSFPFRYTFSTVFSENINFGSFGASGLAKISPWASISCSVGNTSRLSTRSQCASCWWSRRATTNLLLIVMHTARQRFFAHSEHRHVVWPFAWVCFLL